MKKRLTINQFIDKARNIHGDKYDYNKSIYIKSQSKLIITCPKHGDFYITANSHLNGVGCTRCNGRIVHNTESFIAQGKLIHGDKYNYENSIYVSSQLPIKIICVNHGLFEQTPNNHLSGSGCPRCTGKFKTTHDFINQAKKIHGERYDYSKSNYTLWNVKLIVICKKHNEFLITPNNHFYGKGCPKCSSSKGEIVIENYLDKNNVEYIKNKRFVDCKFIKPLPFDFYIQNKNICIEYDGEQHSVEKYEGIYAGKFTAIQRNDKIKTEFCQQNRIRLIRIPHHKFNEIESIIDTELKFVVDYL